MIISNKDHKTIFINSIKSLANKHPNLITSRQDIFEIECINIVDPKLFNIFISFDSKTNTLKFTSSFMNNNIHNILKFLNIFINDVNELVIDDIENYLRYSINANPFTKIYDNVLNDCLKAYINGYNISDLLIFIDPSYNAKNDEYYNDLDVFDAYKYNKDNGMSITDMIDFFYLKKEKIDHIYCYGSFTETFKAYCYELKHSKVKYTFNMYLITVCRDLFKNLHFKGV